MLGVCVSELVDKLKQQRQPNGTTESIGQVLVEWVLTSKYIVLADFCLRYTNLQHLYNPNPIPAPPIHA